MFRSMILASVLSLACGASLGPLPKDVQSRIVGGDDFEIATVPWQAAIEVDVNGEALFYLQCGGSIISDEYILISPACGSGLSTARMRVRVGSDSYNTGGQEYPVTRMITHPSYNSTTRDYEVALLELFKRITMGGNVRRATLPAQGEVVLANSEGYASGWGYTVQNGGSPILLRKVDLTVLNQDECTALYGEITENMFCAGGKGAGTCSHDAGGPFVVDGVVVGVTLYLQGCGREGIPDVFIKVSSVREWIQQYLS